MRPWAEHLAAAGLTVVAPRLPGHGTRWQDMNRTRFADWYGEVERGLRRRCARAATRCSSMGLSMGGTLVAAAGRAARRRGRRRSSSSTPRWPPSAATPSCCRCSAGCSPSLPGHRQRHQEAGRHRAGLRPAAAQGRRARCSRPGRSSARDLARITCPVLVFRSAVDHVVEPVSGRPCSRGLAGGTRRGAGARGQLPRRHARQRRPDDLRRQPRVRPRARPGRRGLTRAGPDRARRAAATTACRPPTGAPWSTSTRGCPRPCSTGLAAAGVAGLRRAGQRRSTPCTARATLPRRPLDRLWVDPGRADRRRDGGRHRGRRPHRAARRGRAGRDRARAGAAGAAHAAAPRAHAADAARPAAAAAAAEPPLPPAAGRAAARTGRGPPRRPTTRSSARSSPASTAAPHDPVPRWPVAEDLDAAARRRAPPPPGAARPAAGAATAACRPGSSPTLPELGRAGRARGRGPLRAAAAAAGAPASAPAPLGAVLAAASLGLRRAVRARGCSRPADDAGVVGCSASALLAGGRRGARLVDARRADADDGPDDGAVV